MLCYVLIPAHEISGMKLTSVELSDVDLFPGWREEQYKISMLYKKLS
jgi:hypothetical protein